ncbi:hypothetical protein HC928_05450 [bacterium]|nr:hypothetical protein [bacterium]
MINKFARIGTFASAIVLGSVTVAQAAPPPDVFKDARGNVFVHGTTATTMNGQANARLGLNEPLSRSVRAGYCGEIRLSTSSTLPSIGDSWTIGATTRTRAALVSITDRALLPRCSGNAFSPALTSAITSAGGFIDATTTTPRVFLTGYTAGVSSDVLFNDVDASRSASANQCGFYRFTNSEANPLPATLTINGMDYTVSSLTVADPPLCQRNAAGTGYVRYNPLSWN